MGNRHPKTQRTPSRRGAVMVLLAVVLTAILSVAALSVDAGRMYQERRNVQAAADAAADAASQELFAKYTKNVGVDADGEARATALAIAQAHGFGNSSASTVTVNIPPVSGAYAGDAGFVEVLIESRLPRTFSHVFASSSLRVQARAVGAGTMVAGKASALVLEPKKKEPLKLKGKSSSFDVAGKVIVNSNNKKAVKVSKKSQLVAEQLLVTGQIPKKSRPWIDADISTGVPPTPDPYASLPAPAKDKKVLDAKSFRSTVNKQEVYNLQPGTYKELKFDKNDKVRMAPGVYFVEKQVKFRDQSSLEALGVMIYNAKSSFKLETTGSVRLTPPTSGTYEGISIFQAREKKSKVEFKKNGNYEISGVIYAPNGEVKFKKTEIELGGYESYDEDDDDEEWDDEDWPDEEQEDDEAEAAEHIVYGASVVARKLSIGKRSHVTLLGVNINMQQPLVGLVE